MLHAWVDEPRARAGSTGMHAVVVAGSPVERAKPARLAEIAPHNNAIYTVAFSPDGRTLASSGGGDLRLWDVSDPAEVVPAGDLPIAGSLRNLAFTPDGELFVPITDQTAAVAQRLDVDAVAAELCDYAGDPITEQEWKRYLPDIPYDPPCD